MFKPNLLELQIGTGTEFSGDDNFKLDILEDEIRLEGQYLRSEEFSYSIEPDATAASYFLTLPLVVGGQKGIVEESDLRIPNMRGIMMARKKPLTVVESVAGDAATSTQSFEKPAPKGAVKLVDADNVDELINLLHTEAKVI